MYGFREEFKGRIRFDHGCIRDDNAIHTRDTCPARYFNTPEEARSALRERELFYQSIGYKIWSGQIAEWNEKTQIYDRIE